MTHFSFRPHVARAAALAAAALPLTAQTTLQGLGTTVPNLTVQDLSADGTAVIATGSSGIYLWTSSNPTFTLVPGSSGASGCDVSNGGAYICATKANPSNGNATTAARWDASTGLWTFLPGLGGQSGTSLSTAYDISADGQVVVGLGWINASIAHAFRWDAGSGVATDLGAFGGNLSSSRPNCISPDGATPGGWDADPSTGVWRAARWNGGVEYLIGCLDPNDPINGPSQAYAISSNGQYIAGESSTGLYTPQNWNENHAFRWDAINGLMDIGTTPVDPFGWGNHATTPTGISDDGHTVVGLSGIQQFGPGIVRPTFIWREGSGMWLLRDYLIALGANQASAWTYNSVSGISADGRVLVGSGRNPSNVSEPWMAILPPISQVYCTAKTNSQGCVPAMAASGIASVSSNLPFTISASNVLNNKSGLLYYGFAPFSAPFQGGTKCVASPTIRTPIQVSGGSPTGNDCTGNYSYDFNARIQSAIDPMLVVGEEIFSQYWSRDPASASTTGLTNGVSFTIFP